MEHFVNWVCDRESGSHREICAAGGSDGFVSDDCAIGYFHFPECATGDFTLVLERVAVYVCGAAAAGDLEWRELVAPFRRRGRIGGGFFGVYGDCGEGFSLGMSRVDRG